MFQCRNQVPIFDVILIVLLILALLKGFDFNIKTIKQKLEQQKDMPSDVSKKIIQCIKLCNKFFYEILYELYRNKDFVYNILFMLILTSDLENVNKNGNPKIYPNAKDISSEFYEGFGRDLLY